MRSPLFWMRRAVFLCALFVLGAVIATVGAAMGASGVLWAAMLWIVAAVYGSVCWATVKGYRRTVYDLRAAQRASWRLREGLSAGNVEVIPTASGGWPSNEGWSVRVGAEGFDDAPRRLRKHGPWGWISEGGASS